jgi:hypothetical protein
MGGPLAWGLGEVLTTPRRKKSDFYEMLHGALESDGIGTGGGLL